MHKAIRYIGSKQKILSFLNDNIFIHLGENSSFFDGFVGSGIVSQYVAENYKNVKLSGGDISYYSNILFNILNIGIDFNMSDIEDNEILLLISEFEKLPLIEGDIFNEFSHLGKPQSFSESRNFFHEMSGKTIDTYKLFLNKKIEENKITAKQAEIMLYFLITYACKVANTTSVFGAFLKSAAKYQPLNTEFVKKIINQLKTISELQTSADFYLGDIVKNLQKIPKQDVIYLDPPYSTRRYESNYHILNYVADLKFSYVELKKDSKTAQPIIMASNPFGKKKETESIFKEMIDEGVKKSNLLAISYNTDGLITQQWMENYCKQQNYNLEVKKLEYKRFKSKLEVTNTTELEEILWLIKK